MWRAFLFGLSAQLFLVGTVFLVFGDEMLPMTRAPLMGAVALVLGVGAAVLAWRASPHPSWPATIGLWFAGFLGVYLVIPVVEIVVVLFLSLLPN